MKNNSNNLLLLILVITIQENIHKLEHKKNRLIPDGLELIGTGEPQMEKVSKK